MRARVLVVSSVLAGLVACSANDPLYIQAPMTLEAGMTDPANPDMLTEARVSLTLPIKPETAADKAKRDALAAKLAPVLVPYVKVGDLELDVEWTITNLDSKPGKARLQLNGANEFFSYDPTLINLAPPDAEDPPKTPGLDDGKPIDIPAMGSVSDLFTEDDLREASIDLDQVTRGNVNPFHASLTVSKNELSFQPLTAPVLDAQGKITQAPTGPVVPREAFAAMVRIDLVFKPDHHMKLDFNVRVRDVRGIMNDLLLTARPADLQMFDPMPYAPVIAASPAP
jgi:hypothetical protein